MKIRDFEEEQEFQAKVQALVDSTTITDEDKALRLVTVASRLMTNKYGFQSGQETLRTLTAVANAHVLEMHEAGRVRH